MIQKKRKKVGLRETWTRNDEFVGRNEK